MAAVVIAVIASAGFIGTLEMKTYMPDSGDANAMKMKGHLTLVLKNAQGQVTDYREFDNVVMKVGKDIVANLIFNGNQSAPNTPVQKTVNQIAIGDNANQTAPALNDRNALQKECNTDFPTGYARQAGTITTNRQGLSSGTIITITGTFAAGNCPNAGGPAAVQEAGLFDTNGAGTGNMFARQVFAIINKGASDSLTVTWTITLT